MIRPYDMVLELVVDAMQTPWHVASSGDAGIYANKMAAKIVTAFGDSDYDPIQNEKHEKVLELSMDAMYAGCRTDKLAMERSHEISKKVEELFSAEESAT